MLWWYFSLHENLAEELEHQQDLLISSFSLFGVEEKMNVPHLLVIFISLSIHCINKFCTTSLFQCLLKVGDMTLGSYVMICFFVLDVWEAAMAKFSSIH